MLPHPQLSDAAESAILKKMESSAAQTPGGVGCQHLHQAYQLELVLVDLILLFEAILTPK